MKHKRQFLNTCRYADIRNASFKPAKPLSCPANGKNDALFPTVDVEKREFAL
jgi:hypothetical protein